MTTEEKLFRFDEHLGGKCRGAVAGVDEVGRGPLAGPVVAAAVVFLKRISLPGLNDSKKISERLRDILFLKIISCAAVGIGAVSEQVIDEINILQATRLAMRNAILSLPRTPSLILIDGRIRVDLPLPQRGIVGGDGESASIAAASIVAKVYRDHLMERLDRVYPDYGFVRHKGYPTPEHLLVLRSRGVSRVHRRSFRPVAQLLQGGGG